MTNSKEKELAVLALKMRQRAYVPYSHFKVGAALLCKDGQIFTGCNIENSAYSPTICAERTAIFKAVSEGFLQFEAIFIAGGFSDFPEDFCPPCGVCRQVMREFCKEDFSIYLVKSENDFVIYTLKELLPKSFSL